MRACVVLAVWIAGCSCAQSHEVSDAGGDAPSMSFDANVVHTCAQATQALLDAGIGSCLYSACPMTTTIACDGPSTECVLTGCWPPVVTCVNGRLSLRMGNVLPCDTGPFDAGFDSAMPDAASVDAATVDMPDACVAPPFGSWTPPPPDLSCPANTWSCGGTCTRLGDDGMNCGACGVRCCGGWCYSGICGVEGPPGTAGCGWSCGPSCIGPTPTNVSVDPHNCGYCGNACAANQQCIGGLCQ
jgi:hypothetical protein